MQRVTLRRTPKGCHGRSGRGTVNPDARRAVAATWAAILERHHPGTRVSVDDDAANLTTLPADREGRLIARREEPDAVSGTLSRVERAA